MPPTIMVTSSSGPRTLHHHQGARSICTQERLSLVEAFVDTLSGASSPSSVACLFFSSQSSVASICCKISKL